MGMGFSKAGLKPALKAVAVLGPALLILYIIIGAVRSGFSAEQSLIERLTAATEILEDREDGWGALGDSYSAKTFGGPWSRLAEGSSHLVVDHIYNTNDFVEFEDFHRLYQDIFPRFINPNRSVDNYGSVVLNKEFDVTYNENTASPLTTVASSYRRWGIPGILTIGIVLGFILTLWNRLLFGLKTLWIRNLLLCMLTYFCLRLYVKEVVALGNAIFIKCLGTS